jgi:hypothetical protein
MNLEGLPPQIASHQLSVCLLAFDHRWEGALSNRSHSELNALEVFLCFLEMYAMSEQILMSGCRV